MDARAGAGHPAFIPSVSRGSSPEGLRLQSAHEALTTLNDRDPLRPAASTNLCYGMPFETRWKPLLALWPGRSQEASEPAAANAARSMSSRVAVRFTV